MKQQCANRKSVPKAFQAGLLQTDGGYVLSICHLNACMQSLDAKCLTQLQGTSSGRASSIIHHIP